MYVCIYLEWIRDWIIGPSQAHSRSRSGGRNQDGLDVEDKKDSFGIVGIIFREEDVAVITYIKISFHQTSYPPWLH